MRASCIPPFAQPTFLEFTELDRMLQRAAAGLTLYADAPVERAGGVYTRTAELWHRNGTPRSPEEIVGG
ncbi:MAG TPA: hypothetical protein VIU16_03920 [Gaiellaceae bacterium]